MSDDQPWLKDAAAPTGENAPWEKDAPVAEQSEPRTTVGSAAKQVASGVNSGIVDLLGMPANVVEFAEKNNPYDWLFRQVDSQFDKRKADFEKIKKDSTILHAGPEMLDSANMKRQIKKQVGFDPFPLPKTTAEKYFHNIGEFAPGVLMGPGSLLNKAGQAAVGGTLSEAGGEMAEGTVFETPARFLGGIVGGGIGGAFAERAPSAAAETLDQAIGAFERLGLIPTAATTGVGGQTAAIMEANVLPQLAGSAERMKTVRESNLSGFVDKQQQIAHEFGAPEPSKFAQGEKLQNIVKQQWQQAKEKAGNVLNDIEMFFQPNEFFDVPNFRAAIEKPVGGRSKTLESGAPEEPSSFGPMLPKMDVGPSRSLADMQLNVDEIWERSVAGKSSAEKKMREMTVDPFIHEAEGLLRATGGKLSFQDMKQLATRYGNAVDRKFAKNVNDAQISQLEKALRKDMESAIKTRPSAVEGAWNTAKGDYRKAMVDYRQAFKRLIENADVPVNAEKVYDIFAGSASTGGRADLRMFTKVWNVLSKEQRGDLSAFVLSRMGNKDPSKLADLEGWSLDKFLGDYAKISPEAKELLFKTTGKKESQAALDDLLKVAQSMTVTEKLASKSKSGTGAMVMGQIGSTVALMAAQQWALAGLSALSTLAGPYVAAQILTNPAAVKKLAHALDHMHGAQAGAVKAMIPLTSQSMDDPFYEH